MFAPVIEKEPVIEVSRRRLLVAGSGAMVAGALGTAATSSAATVGLTEKIRAIDISTRGVLSVAVEDRRSRKVWTYNSGMRNECASIVKVLVLATVCRRAQTAGRGLTTWERNQAARMIRYSDNACTTNLWRSVGGAPAVQSMANRAGMGQTRASTAWGLTTTSAYDQLRLLSEICWNGAVLDAGCRRFILQEMSKVTPGQRWGVGAHGTSQVKNGWLPYRGQWRINSIGHVGGAGRNHTLAILQRTPTMGIGTSVANQVARAVYDHLATPL